MSVGRRIDDGTGNSRTARVLQGVRLSVALGALAIIAAMLVRVGHALRPGHYVLFALLGFIALGSFGAFAWRRWPHAFGPLTRMAQRMDPNRRLRLTRDGRILVGITIAVGAAAVNTGNNFLYLVLGLLLALVSVSGVLSEWTLRDVRVCLEQGGERFAGLPGMFAFHVFNQKKRLASMSIEVLGLLAAPGAVGGDTPYKAPGRFFIRLRPTERQRGIVRVELPRRGVWRLLGFEVATAYPFGFIRKWKHEVPEAHEATDVIVYPRPVPVAEQLRRIRMLIGERTGERAGRGDEFFSLRDHRPTDDVRKVAWKRSARVGRLMVREDEEPRGRVITLVVAGGVATPSPVERQRYEHACSIAAGLVLAMIDRGDEVGLVAGKGAVAPGRADAREALLQALARAHLEDELAALPEGSSRGVVVLVDGVGQGPAAPVHLTIPVGLEAARSAA